MLFELYKMSLNFLKNSVSDTTNLDPRNWLKNLFILNEETLL